MGAAPHVLGDDGVTRSEPSIDLTTEELVQLAAISGLPLPTGIDDEAFDEEPDAYRDRALELADRTLRVRGIVSDGDDGDVVVAPAVTTILETAGQPGLLGVVSVEGDGVVETRFFSARPELGVEHEAIAPSVHRLTPFMTRDFLVRLLRFTDLRPADVPAVEPFELPITTLEQATGFAEEGDRLAAVEVIEGAGVGELTARAFASALVQKKGTVTATLLSRPDPDQVVGGMVIWLDGGLKGNWIIERVGDGIDEDAEPVAVEIRPASAKDITTELVSFLPDALAEAE